MGNFLAILAIYAVHPAWSEPFGFEPGEFSTLKNIAEAIAHPHDGESVVYVSLGRSLAPIAAYLEETRLEEQVFTLPATGAKVLDLEKASGEQLENLFSHVDLYLPKEKIPANATIVLMDYSNSGLSLKNGKKLIERWQKERGLSHPVESVAVTYHLNRNLRQVADAADRIIQFKNSLQSTRYASERYENFAKFSQQAPIWPKDFVAGPIQHTNPQYEALKAAIRTWIQTPCNLRDLVGRPHFLKPRTYSSGRTPVSDDGR